VTGEMIFTATSCFRTNNFSSKIKKTTISLTILVEEVTLLHGRVLIGALGAKAASPSPELVGQRGVQTLTLHGQTSIGCRMGRSLTASSVCRAVSWGLLASQKRWGMSEVAEGMPADVAEGA
jgi:hypothetical protein